MVLYLTRPRQPQDSLRPQPSSFQCSDLFRISSVSFLVHIHDWEICAVAAAAAAAIASVVELELDIAGKEVTLGRDPNSPSCDSSASDL